MTFQSSLVVKEKMGAMEVHACACGMGLLGEFKELKIRFLKFFLFTEDLPDLSTREIEL